MGEEAWKRFIAGDEESFSTLYHVYYQELFAYARKIGFDEETCKDAIQGCLFQKFIPLKVNCYTFKIFEFYLLRSLKNQLLDIYNKESKIQEINYEDILIANEKNIIDQIIDEEKQTQLSNKISLLLQTLPPKQRKIIHFHYQLNLSYSEIGEILNLSPDAVKKTIYRALKK